MYRMAILSGKKDSGKQLAVWIKAYCSKEGIFPHIDVYEDIELFYREWNLINHCAVIVDLPGTMGLNEVEHIRSLCRECGLIWCSDLDFSLHAFRLRADYFILSPLSEAKLREGIAAWISNTKRQRHMQNFPTLENRSVY